MKAITPTSPNLYSKCCLATLFTNPRLNDKINHMPSPYSSSSAHSIHYLNYFRIHLRVHINHKEGKQQKQNEQLKTKETFHFNVRIIHGFSLIFNIIVAFHIENKNTKKNKVKKKK